MKTNRKSGRMNILRRIEKLESFSIDGSGLIPESPEWLAFWQRQVGLYCTGQEHVQLTLDGVRAVIRAAPHDGRLEDYAPGATVTRVSLR